MVSKGKAGGCSRDQSVTARGPWDGWAQGRREMGWELRLQEQEVLSSHEERSALPKCLHQYSEICLPSAFDLLIFLSYAFLMLFVAISIMWFPYLCTMENTVQGFINSS